MATKPINRYTVQESNNLKIYENYSSYQLTTSATDATDAADNATYTFVEGTDWISNGDGPAKKILIVPYVVENNNILLQLKVNGSYGDIIEVGDEDFPITIDKMLVDRIKMASSDGTGGAGGANEIFTIIAFH